MAVRFMPFAHWAPNWGGAALGAGAAGLAALALEGQGTVALALLAGAGAASGVLLAAGQLHFGRAEGREEGYYRDILSALPEAVAITDRKGSVLWKSEAFRFALGSGGGTASFKARRASAGGGGIGFPPFRHGSQRHAA